VEVFEIELAIVSEFGTKKPIVTVASSESKGGFSVEPERSLIEQNSESHAAPAMPAFPNPWPTGDKGRAALQIARAQAQ